MALTNRPVILFKYFRGTTDEDHPVSLTDISAHLVKYGIIADLRTLRRDIEQPVEFGLDIIKDRRGQNLYHTASRHFEADVEPSVETVLPIFCVEHPASVDTAKAAARTNVKIFFILKFSFAFISLSGTDIC